MTETSPHLLEEKCAPCSGAHLRRVALSPRSHPFRKSLLVLPLSPRSLLVFISFLYCFLWSMSSRIEGPVWLRSRAGMQKGRWRRLCKVVRLPMSIGQGSESSHYLWEHLPFFFFPKEFSSLPSNNLPYLQESKEEIFTIMTTHQEGGA